MDNNNTIALIGMGLLIGVPLLIVACYGLYRRIAQYEKKLDDSYRNYDLDIIKECPLCKSKEVTLQEAIKFPNIEVNVPYASSKIKFYTHDIKSTWKIRCIVCGCSSTEFNDISEAINNWNNRTERIEKNGIQ